MLSILLSLSAFATEPQMIWPLCGRITESPPPGWSAPEGCPDDRADQTDLPLAATYGPRQVARPSHRYEWHRGIDIPTACGTPIFAIDDATVMWAGEHPRYDDRMIRLRHGECTDSCLHSEFQHISHAAVQQGQTVQQGDLIGWTGFFGIGKGAHASSSSACAGAEGATEFLHLEIRQGPESDPASVWARDAIHPLRVLPYPDDGARGMQVRITNVGTWDPLNPNVELSVTSPPGELDVARVELRIIDLATGRTVRQQGDGEHPLGYPVLGTTYDFEQYNRAWTHKNSSTSPWESYETCPFAGEHGAHYSDRVHLYDRHPGDPRVGWFNGYAIFAKFMTPRSPSWMISTRYTHLAGTDDPDNLCVVAWAEDISGARSEVATWTTNRNAAACTWRFETPFVSSGEP